MKFKIKTLYESLSRLRITVVHDMIMIADQAISE